MDREHLARLDDEAWFSTLCEAAWDGSLVRVGLFAWFARDVVEHPLGAYDTVEFGDFRGCDEMVSDAGGPARAMTGDELRRFRADVEMQLDDIEDTARD